MSAVAVRLRRGLDRLRPTPPVPTGCRAPLVSMYLDQRGLVRACCQNAWHVLGNVAETRLRDIWDGPKTMELRQALAAADLSLGCEFCSWQVDAGHPEMAYARTYDTLPATSDDLTPPWPTQLEMSLSNTCNLQCTMCNGEWSSSIRRHREGLPPLPTVYDERFFDDLRPFAPHLHHVKVLGGEPFLATETLRVMDVLIDESSPARLHITTNGTQWTPRVERILHSLPCDIVVSLDSADPDTYASIRVGATLDQTLTNLARYRDAIAPRGRASLSTCLMTTNWQGFIDVCTQADHLDLGLYVNTVSDPAHLSLYRLPPDHLAPIVEHLDTIDRQRAHTLGRSRPVWDKELTRLHTHLDDRRHGRTITWLDDRRTDIVIGNAHYERTIASRERGLPELVERHLGPGSTRLVLDGSTIVGADGPGDLLGHPLATLAGRDVEALFAETVADHGVPGDEEVLYRDDVDRHAIERRFPSGLRLRSVTTSDVEGEDGHTVTWVRLFPAGEEPPALDPGDG